MLHEAALQAGRQAVSRRDGLQCRTKGGERIDADVSLLAVPDESPGTAVESDATPGDTGTTLATPDSSATTAVAVVHTDRDESRRARQIAGLLCILGHTVWNRLNVVLGRLEQIRHEDGRETAARADPELEPTPLGPLLEEEIASARQTYPEADVALVDDVGAVAVAATPLLESVFRNLVVNAVQHNDAGTPCVRLRVTTTDDWVTVRVADDGPGVPDDRRRELFGRGETGLDSDGSGIGLYLVDRLVTQFGGRGHVEDRDPTAFPLPSDERGADRDHPGSVFVVELDRVAAD